MFRALEQHFGLATARLVCFDPINRAGRVSYTVYFFPGRGRNVIRVAASFCAAGVNRWTLTRLVLCLTKLLDGARGMDWKRDLDALIESTRAFANDVKRQPIPNLPAAITAAEQVLADTSKPITGPGTITPMTG